MSNYSKTKNYEKSNLKQVEKEKTSNGDNDTLNGFELKNTQNTIITTNTILKKDSIVEIKTKAKRNLVVQD